MFKTVALPVAAAMMLLTVTSCSSDDNMSEEPTSKVVSTKGYAIPVTVNVSRQGDSANGTTRATYDTSTKTLSFSTGDKLFIHGTHGTAGNFAGTLTWTSGTTFEGTVYTESLYSGTCKELFASTPTSDIQALLLPAGYESYGYITISSPDTYSSTVDTDEAKAFVTGDKTLGVAQLSFEQAQGYSDGFVLEPQQAVMSCSVSGLTPNTAYTFTASDSHYYPAGSVTTDANGIATFCVGFLAGSDYSLPYTISDGTYTYYLGSRKMEKNKIYNVSPELINLANVSSATTAGNGDVLTGTLGSNVKISIAAGATVTLQNATINGMSDVSYPWAGITCEGSATINLEGTNTVKGFYSHYPGIQPGGSNTTLTIQSNSGKGTLAASSNGVFGYGAGIGGGYNISCGNITINSGTVTATAPYNIGAGIGAGGAGGGSFSSSTCGAITISGGTVSATGGTTAAGIGSGSAVNQNGDATSTCTSITITSDVTKVDATKGEGATDCIGNGIADGSNATSGVTGTITIGGTTYWDGSTYQGTGATYLTQSSITYPSE